MTCRRSCSSCSLLSSDTCCCKHPCGGCGCDHTVHTLQAMAVGPFGRLQSSLPVVKCLTVVERVCSRMCICLCKQCSAGLSVADAAWQLAVTCQLACQ